MAKKKEGDLRFLKHGVVFGPTDRAGLEKLLSAGRLTRDDRVSVRNAEWIPIADYLAIPAAPPAAAPSQAATPPGGATAPAGTSPTETSEPPATRTPRAGELRVIKGGRMINALTRKDVSQLMTTGHVTDDDLVCALDGPWMRVGDFLTTRARGRSREKQPAATSSAEPSDASPITPAATSSAAAATGPEPREGGSPQPNVSQPASPSVETKEGHQLVVMAGRVEVMQSKDQARVLVDPMATVGTSGGLAYKVSAAKKKDKKSDDDQWYVRIRAMCSAPLGKHHLKALYQSREITSDSMARHPKWDENDWRPIHAIPELAELSRP